MTSLRIANGRVIDPASGFDRIADVAIRDGVVQAIGELPHDFEASRTLDAQGCLVLPGLVDLAARLDTPGRLREDRFESESAAAVAGGITRLVCMPDSDPVLDAPEAVAALRSRFDAMRRACLHPLGALTLGLQGEVLTEMAALAEAGCVGFSQAEQPIADTRTLRNALAYASSFGLAVWLRPQDRDLGHGVMAEGALATRLGLAGVPVAAETIAIFTLVELMRSTGARVHLCRLSSADGVALLRAAKAEGLPISADVGIHSLHLVDSDIGFFDSHARLAPPLRQQRDREALSAALADGTIDALVSDHVPVDAEAKQRPFAESVPGATGLELLLPLALQWAERGGAGLRRAIEVLSAAPGRLLGVEGAGRLAVGGVADLCVVDPDDEWVVTPQALRSQGKATPFGGYALRGRVRFTLVDGRLVHG